MIARNSGGMPISVLLIGATAVTLVRSASGSVQQSPSTQPLVFDRVTVVDVKHGKSIPDQRVVIVGNRIRAQGKTGAVPLPSNAQVIEASGKYLIPGLWDLHTHSRMLASATYPLFIANGVTGIRDAGSEILLDSLRQWRREIVAGTRVGPPRQILSGPPIGAPDRDMNEPCVRQSNAVPPGDPTRYYTCVSPDSTDARRLVDSLRLAGIDMLKTYNTSRAAYLAIAAAARRAGVPFGGHIALMTPEQLDPFGLVTSYQFHEAPVTAIEASDNGARIIDHFATAGKLDTFCLLQKIASIASCRPVAEHFRRNGTWWVPTMAIDYDEYRIGRGTELASKAIYTRLHQCADEFWAGTLPHGNWLHQANVTADSLGALALVRRVDLPILAGTDVNPDTRDKLVPGFALHAELAIYVAEGLTPLAALQSATLNPARMLHATDSLGTIAPGKLADLVLLDADPLADITNTTTIRAVVANGRYYDRVMLDELLVQAEHAAHR